MNESDAPTGESPASLRRIGDSLLGLVQNRVQLFAVEFQGEKLRLLDTLVRLGLALSIAFLGLLLATATLALFVWQRTGFAGLIVMTVVFLVVGVLLLWRLQASLCQSPAAFAETLNQFRKDRECLQRKS